MKETKKKSFRFLSMILALIMVATLIPINPVTVEAKAKKKIVVLYFSATGTTKSVAKKSRKALAGN